jgi:hypothetical protein
VLDTVADWRILELLKEQRDSGCKQVLTYLPFKTTFDYATGICHAFTYTAHIPFVGEGISILRDVSHSLLLLKLLNYDVVLITVQKREHHRRISREQPESNNKRLTERIKIINQILSNCQSRLFHFLKEHSMLYPLSRRTLVLTAREVLVPSWPVDVKLLYAMTSVCPFIPFLYHYFK